MRSTLENSRPICSLYYLIYLNQIEDIQKKVVSHFNYRFYKPVMTYHQSCKEHGLLSLEDRRMVKHMSCLLYDVTNGNIDSTELVSK